MRSEQFVGVHRGLGGVHTTGRFKPRYRGNIGRVDQPVTGGHRCAVVQERRVSYHSRIAVGVTQHHREVALRATTQQRCDLLDVERGRCLSGR